MLKKQNNHISLPKWIKFSHSLAHCRLVFEENRLTGDDRI